MRPITARAARLRKILENTKPSFETFSRIGYTEFESVSTRNKKVLKAMEELDQTVRQTIRRVRIQQGLTQAELAERLGVHRDMISRIETGKRSLELGEFFDWADALGVTYEELFDAICEAIPGVYAA